MEDPPEDDEVNLIDCQAILMVVIIGADNELTAEECETAANLLTVTFGVSQDIAFAALEEASGKLEGEKGADFQRIIQESVGLIRSELPIEQRTQLYNQLEMVARADGLVQEEIELLSDLRSDWALPESAFGEVVRQAVPVSSKKKSESGGCAVLLLAGFGTAWICTQVDRFFDGGII